MPAQDRVRGNQTMAMQDSGQPPDEGSENSPVRPVHARSWVGAAEDGDFVAQHKELDFLGRGRAAHQQDQPEQTAEDQAQQPHRHPAIMSDQRSPLVSNPGRTSGTPHQVCTAKRLDEIARGGRGDSRFGFVRCGLVRHAGFKFGRWLDLAFYQKLLDTPDRPIDG